ncbi:MAG: 2-hydroxychromene-2-carboxylate isomerase [Piscinibacter sp.]|uniref:2-hydroxychromene-2-carboxylate isomerase n=1 Tax=Piscinibacter sp. TaxID=1903157 RepID=UPI001B67277F|nr:2-hydroxychromene-2-carboxylate isomerase [Piscinibacter sp.]MBP5989713.1 2-hydroxychromene-2-carboxylate isomerase [Piscinibacter sp.]MBP6027861.1 2-hydroxychromene-2-carboxylate isomerase [Piscinibacter sp.]
MKHLEFWFDPISPYAYLAFEQLPQALEGLSYRVDYQPILFAGLLRQWGQKGPAEIEPKRAWTFRQIAWAAHQLGIPIATPAQHPFNPLALLRLLHACAGEGGTPNRWQCERVFHHVWRGEGADANDAARLQALRATLAPQRDPDSEAVKQSLKGNTARALALGLFGVPTVAVDGRLFWGLDSLAMLAAYLKGDAWFDGPDWDEAARARAGVVRG